jgi:hypothetical protein
MTDFFSLAVVKARIKCEYCDKLYAYRSGLDVHVKPSSTVWVRFACEQCDYLATRKSDLKKHVRAAVDEKLKEHQCVICLVQVDEFVEIVSFRCRLLSIVVVVLLLLKSSSPPPFINRS